MFDIVFNAYPIYFFLFLGLAITAMLGAIGGIPIAESENSGVHEISLKHQA